MGTLLRLGSWTTGSTASFSHTMTDEFPRMRCPVAAHQLEQRVERGMCGGAGWVQLHADAGLEDVGLQLHC